MKYASLGARFASHIIDRIIDALILTAVFLMTAATDSSRDEANAFVGLVFVLVYCVLIFVVLGYVYYRYVYLPSKSGQTWGQKIMNVKMVMESGSIPSQGKLVIRYLILELLGVISLIGLLIDDEKKNRTVHDMAAHTVVVEV